MIYPYSLGHLFDLVRSPATCRSIANESNQLFLSTAVAHCTGRVHGFAVGHFGDDAGAEIEAEVVAEIDADADAVAVIAVVVETAAETAADVEADADVEAEADAEAAAEAEADVDAGADAGVDAHASAETCRTGVRTDRTGSLSSRNSTWPIAAWYHVQAPKSLAWALPLSHSIPRSTEYRLI